MIPLYGFLEGDTIGLLLLADPGDTLGELARRLQVSASVRVEPFPDPRVVVNGRQLSLALTVRECGFSPLMRIDVIRGGG